MFIPNHLDMVKEIILIFPDTVFVSYKSRIKCIPTKNTFSEVDSFLRKKQWLRGEKRPLITD